MIVNTFTLLKRFLELENPEKMHHSFYKNINQHNWIIILEWFLIDHVTLKTGVMAAENSYWIWFQYFVEIVFLDSYCFSGLMGSAWLSDLTALAVLTIISGQFELTAGLVTVGGDGGCVSACAWMERSLGATTQHRCIVGNSSMCDVVEMVSLVIRVSWECARCP